MDTEKLKKSGIVLLQKQVQNLKILKQTRKQHFYKDYIEKWLSPLDWLCR